MSRANEAVHPYEVVKHYYGGGMEESCVPGITLREHFAAMAMQGFMCRAHLETNSQHAVAALSVIYADALLAALAKVQP